MSRLADLAAAAAAAAGPGLLRLLSFFARTLLARGLNRRKDLPMTDLLETAAADQAAAAPAPAAPIAAAPIATAPAASAPAEPVNPSAVVGSVVQTVTSHPAVAAANAPSIIASILSGLYQAEPAIFAVTRASQRTQTEVGLGLGLAEIIVSAFLHPAQ